MIRETASLEDMYKSLHNTRFYIKKDSSLSYYVENNLDTYLQMEEYQNLINYHNWTESDVYFDVLGKLKYKNQRVIAAHFKHMLSLTGTPTDPVWGQYSYQEIIDMAEQGAHVPDDILQWAKAMANDDIVSYDMSDIGSDDDILNNLDADMVDYRAAEAKQQMKRYSQIADKQKNEAQEKVTDTENVSIEMEKQQENLESKQKLAADKIEMYKNELENLQARVSNGEELTSAEQIKYRALSGKIEEENHNIVLVTNQVDKEVENLFDSINDTFEDADTYNTLSEQLNIKAENFVETESKLNSGTLHSTISNIGLFSNNYQNNALAGSLSFNLLEISRNIYLQTSLLNNNLFAASNIRFELAADINNTANIESTDNFDNEISDNMTVEDNEENNINPDNDKEDEINPEAEIEPEPIESQQAQNNIDEDNNTEDDYSESEDISLENDRSTELDDNNENEDNNNLTMEDGKSVEAKGKSANVTANNATLRTEKAENDFAQTVKDTKKHTSSIKNKQNKINSVAKQSTSLETKADSLNAEKDNVLAQIETHSNPQNIIDNEAPASENINAPADNAELSALTEQSEELEKNIEKNENITENLSKNVANEASDVSEDVEKTDKSESKEQDSARQNIEAHKTLSENILDIAQKFIAVKKPGAILMLSPWTEATGITMNNIGRYGETASFIANEAVMLAHGNLIDCVSAIKDFRDGSLVKKSKTNAVANQVKKDANTANSQTKNIKNNLANSQLQEQNTNEEHPVQPKTEPENNQGNSQNIESNLSYENNNGNENKNSEARSKEADKKDSPRNESMMVQQTIMTQMTISDKDIENETVKKENAGRKSDLKALNKQIAEQINSSKPEYMKAPNIVDEEEVQSEEYTPDINEEQTEAISADSAKESIRAEVRSAVLELMQSTLSETNKNAQKKDSDVDKRHKLFTQFEREKKDALRKTVQKINRARDAR